MNTMDEARRAELLTKFPALSNERPMAPEGNTQVRAIDRADEIIQAAWGEDQTAVLVDPARVSALAARADEAAAKYHRRAGMDGLRYATGDDTAYDPADHAMQGVVRIWRVHSTHVHIVRERWRAQRFGTPAEAAADWLQYTREVLDNCPCSLLAAQRTATSS